MGPRKKSGGGRNQASGSKQASGVTLPQLSLWVPKSSQARASNADGGQAGASELLAHLAGEQAAKPRASSWLGRKQQPSEKLAATSSALFPAPSPHERGCPSLSEEFPPHTCAHLVDVAGGGDRRGPTETPCLPDPPPLLSASAGKSPVFLECEAPLSSTLPQTPLPLTPRAHASQAECRWSESWIVP